MRNKKNMPDLFVVGIGASAGGLEPLQAVISHLSSLQNVAVITAQHLSPDYKSMLVELLGRKTKIPVKHVENGMEIAGNTIYIAPPNADVVVDGKVFSLKKPIVAGAHPSIDILFASMAKVYKNKACGIILSGTGKDGTRGIIAIKKAGGVVIVQDPITAKYDGMPRSAMNTEVVDHVLSPEQIGDEFLTLVSHARSKEAGIKDFAAETDDAFLQVFDLLERRISIDFSSYKTSTLSRRLQKRINEKKFDSEQEYLDYIQQNPEEIDALFEEILIGVTSFFRDPAAFERISNIMEKIVHDKKSGESLRLWISGCATGEEAYTYAILIAEILERTKKVLPVQIFATDIDIKALHKARHGIYSPQTLQTIPKVFLKKYFTKLDTNTYELNKEIRKMVLYSRHDVTSNPPFLRLDLISCRNLLIYFNADLQKRVLPLFYYALNPGGYLVLGKSENIGQFQNLFSTTDAHLKIFQRKANEGKVMKFPQFRPTKTKKINFPEKDIVREDLTIAEMVKETIYNNFDHPYVVIDQNMDIVELSGDISPYIKFKQGSASLNFMKLVIPQLQIESRALIGKVMKSMQPHRGNVKKIVSGDKTYFVQILVKSLLYAKSNNPYFIIIFEAINLAEKLLITGKETGNDNDSARMIELEQELDATKEHMNSLVEELETSNEELQALNEELQASNEELQASNEELETSNEELQATNEELENAYSELREANRQIAIQKDEIEESAESMKTLLNNTLIGFILIDRDYKVIVFNKTAAEVYKTLFNTEIEVGASFIKVLPDSIFPAFHQNFRKALEGKQIVTEEEIQTKDKGIQFFDFNFTPVKLETDETESRMVAVSFVDTSKRKKAELTLLQVNEELLQEKQFMQTLAESLPSIVWTTDAKGAYIYCNQQFLDYSGVSFEEIQKLSWKPFIHPDDWKQTARLWKGSLKSGGILSIEHRIKNKSGEYYWHLTQARAIKGSDGRIHMWIGTSTNIHEQKQLDERKTEFISIASHELKTPVTSLKAYTHILDLLLKKNNTAKFPETIVKMDAQLDRLTDLINDLLDVSKIESGKLQFKKSEFSFEELIEEITDSMNLISQQHKISRIGQVNKTIKSDRDRLEQVFINLISNAIKYSPNANEVILKTEMNHKEIIVSVQDFGIGIREDNQKKVFERFFRVSDDHAVTFPGMGLGLYISAEIIKRLGGKIWFESKEGKGSTFYFTIPVKEEN